jgi:hypothetical protein
MSVTAANMELVKKKQLQKIANLCFKEGKCKKPIKAYGTKADFARRICDKGGKQRVADLIKTSKADKGKVTPRSTKAKFKENERKILIAHGATNKKKIEAEIERLWKQQATTSKCKGATSKKQSKAKADIGSIVITSTMLTPAAAKARNLVFVGPADSNGKTFKYKVIDSIAKKRTRKASCEKDDRDDEMYTMEQAEDIIQDRATERLQGNKKLKREHIDGILEAFGVDSKGWTMKDAKEEMSIQIHNVTDNEEESSDESEDDDDGESDDGESDDGESDDDEDEN